ncbi:SIR2 family protein [Burkholderia multivorans]|uniref:SIR2 family protein n=1 Tax=Burkholderia multivorans TaxID=87883 RepID=UPI000CFF76B7|nr:SIR2 family protein [Burkholderia multivorans]AYY98420.1 SIR2 family protein [Burkholderia multivorans]MBU9120534.1 SIR2 family protein [Burkholderia multivorans]PRF47863.1 SIR2 family protein [Burkholderia multivorans]PRG52072.1 SIR2 family protein [Burkholderia multivorans]PRG79252.1 SIR2 family protein [Burkholderia multivorans]
MPLNYSQYQEEVTQDVAEVLRLASCQPILFVGSGFAKRYASGPNWPELLTLLAKDCPLIDKDFPYYEQTYNSDYKKIGTIFTDLYREWAWGKGKTRFPAEFFSGQHKSDIFIKYAISEHLKNLGPKKGSYGSAALDAEIEALKKISAHSVITTNYDTLVESIFPQYERVIGQQILRKSYLAIGEVFKIHGCITEPQSIVINEADYERFEQDHKYLSAKLLTYFVEHPLIFIGYRADDPNIKKILYDVDRMIRIDPNGDYDLVPNIYILERDEAITDGSYPAREKVISVGLDTNIRVKSISAASFEWVYKAFGQAGNLEKIDTKLLRALMARSVELVRSSIPKKHVEIDFQTLEHAVNSGDEFAKLFGVTSLSDPSKVNLSYKYLLSGVATALGLKKGWNDAQKLINILKQEDNFDMKASDNKYHISIPSSKTGVIHRYSEAAVDLLQKVQNGEPYTIDRQELNFDEAAKAAAS